MGVWEKSVRGPGAVFTCVSIKVSPGSVCLALASGVASSFSL